MNTNKDAQAAFPLSSALEILNILWQANREMDRISARMEVRLGVTAQQRLIIRCIGRYPGINVGQLADLLRIDAGTMSTVLKRMEERRLVVRTRDPRDRRRLLLSLTTNGRTLDQPTEGTVEGVVESLLAGVDARDISSALGVLRRLADLLGEVGSDFLWRQRPALYAVPAPADSQNGFGKSSGRGVSAPSGRASPLR